MVTSRGTPPVIVPDRPRIVVVLHSDRGGTVNGQQIQIPTGTDPRTVLMTEACRFAATLGRPVRVEAHDRDGVWELIAYPDGSVAGSGSSAGGRKLRRPVLQRRGRQPGEPPDGAGSGRAESGLAESGRAESGRAGADSTVDSVAAASRPAWYQAPTLPTRPRPLPVEGPGPVAGGRPGAPDASTGRPRAGLAPGTDRPPHAPGPEPMVRSGRSPGRRSLSSASGLAALVLGGLTLAVLIGSTVPRIDAGAPEEPEVGQERVPAGHQPEPSAGATPSVLDVTVPPGYSRTPVWTTAIAGWTRSVATDGGTVLTRDPQGHVLLLDPATGERLWVSDATTTADQVGPWPATVDGVRVAALSGPGRLTYWRLPARRTPPAPAGAPGPAGTSPGTVSAGPPSGGGGPVTVPLPAGAVVTWVGASPLVQLPNQTVAVIRSGALAPVPLPAGSRGLAADASGVLAVKGSTWLRQPAIAAPVAARAIPRPQQAGAAPLRVEAVGTGLLLSVWSAAKGNGQIVALMDTRTGATVVQAAVTASADLRTYGIVREVGGTQLALGPVVIDTYAAKVNLLDLRYIVKILTRGHAWTMFHDRATDLHLTPAGDFTTVPFATGEAVLPVGVSRLADGSDRAVVVTALRDGWALCGLGAA